MRREKGRCSSSKYKSEAEVMKIESYEITWKGGRKNRYAGSVSGKGGVMEALGGAKKEQEKGKREGEDTSAAA